MPTPHRDEAGARRQRSDAWQSALRTTLGLTLVGSAIALGGAHAVTSVVIAALLTIALLVRSLLPYYERPPRLGLAAAPVSIALVIALVQLVPLPPELLAVIAPKTLELVSLSTQDAWAPLTLDLPATALEAAKLAGYLAAALLATSLFSGTRGRTTLATWIAVGGAAVVTLGFAQALADVHRPFDGFGQPGNVFVSSFVNPNHLAGYLGLTSFVTLGLAFAQPRGRRAVWLTLAVLFGAGVMLSLSRGGIVSYVFAALFFAGTALLARSRRVRHAGVVYALLGAVLALSAYLAYSNIVHELWTLGDAKGYSKAELWRPLPSLLTDFAFFGAGRGAGFAAYPHYSLVPASLTFTHLENAPLQALLDFGPLAGAVLIALTLLGFALILRRVRHDPLTLGIATALLFIAAQNFGDFGLELPALALLATLVFAAELTPSRTGAPLRLVPRSLAVASSVALVVIALVAGTYGSLYALERDTAAVREALKDDAHGAAESPLVTAALTRHPTDYLLPLLVAERLGREPDGARAALRYTNRSLVFSPKFAASHRLAGRLLWQLGFRAQALLEYRSAARLAPASTDSIAKELAAQGGVAALVGLAGEGTGEADVALRRRVASLLVGRREPEAARALLTTLRDLRPEDFELRARVLIASGDVDGAEDVAHDLAQEHPRHPASYTLLSECRRKAGDRDGARDALERGLGMSDRPQPLLRAKVHLLLAGKEFELARATAQQLLEHAGEPAAQAEAHWLKGQSYVGEGKRALALHEWQRARDANPGALGYRAGIISLREQMGDLAGARSELERAKAEVGTSAALDETEKRLKHLVPRPTLTP